MDVPMALLLTGIVALLFSMAFGFWVAVQDDFGRPQRWHRPLAAGLWIATVMLLLAAIWSAVIL